jgi:hypothetical protein
VLNQITLVANAAPEKGACKLLISINGVLATVGIWQPPGAIVMTPNDAVVLEVQPSSAKEKGKGGCAAEFVVLGTALIPPLIVTD